MARDAITVDQSGTLEALGWSSRDAVGFVVAASAAILILINTLFLQPGPHPAPMVKSSIAVITAPAPTPAGSSTNVARARSDEPGAPKVEQAKAGPAS